VCDGCRCSVMTTQSDNELLHHLVSLILRAEAGLPAQNIRNTRRLLEFVALRNGTEDTDDDCSNDHSCDDGLQKDGILDLSESWLLDPYLTVKDLPNEIPLLVFRNPWLVFVAVTRPKAIERSSLEIVA
jgi:hypothetical protein